jgi:hypothetical protein
MESPTQSLGFELNHQLTALAEIAQRELETAEVDPPTADQLPSIHVGVLAAMTAGALLEQVSQKGEIVTRETLIAFEGLMRSALKVLPALSGAHLAQLEGTSADDAPYAELGAIAAEATSRLSRGLDLAYRGFFGEVLS